MTMSDLVIQPIRIDEIKPHPNADKLEICVIGGWEVITGLDNHKVGDIVVHIPPEVLLPKVWADKWDVTKYLSWRKNSEKGRVRAVKLRGTVSYGFLVPNESGEQIGTDLADYYGIEKWEPPMKGSPGGQHMSPYQAAHRLFPKYTDIQNLRNYKTKLDYSQELVVTEKIHGTNSRIGWIKIEDRWHLMVGTHNTQRWNPNDWGLYILPLRLYEDALFRVCDYAKTLGDYTSIVFYGEIFGPSVQDLQYGDKQDYRVFDIRIDGEFVSWNGLREYKRKCNLPLVPLIREPGKFTFEELLELSQGNTELKAGNHVREGIVVKPTQEMQWKQGEFDPNPKRMIFKVINPDYLTRKEEGSTEYH